MKIILLSLAAWSAALVAASAAFGFWHDPDRLVIVAIAIMTLVIAQLLPDRR